MDLCVPGSLNLNSRPLRLSSSTSCLAELVRAISLRNLLPADASEIWNFFFKNDFCDEYIFVLFQNSVSLCYFFLFAFYLHRNRLQQWQTALMAVS